MSKSNQAFTKQMDDDYLAGKLIRREDIPLYIDVFCYSCKRRVTLSNTVEIDGRRYCQRCRGSVNKIGSVLVKTIRWQCSGCDHLCALLLDESIKPNEIVKCPNANDEWRTVDRPILISYR